MIHLVAMVAILAMFATACGSSSERSSAPTADAGTVETSDERGTEPEPTTDVSTESEPEAPTESPADAVSSDAVSSEAAAMEEGETRVAEDYDPGVIEPAPLPEPDPEPQPRPQAGLLTAGEIDDNLNYAFFQGYLDRTANNYGQELPRPDLSERITVQVNDANGVGIANTAVQFFNSDGPAYIAHTNSAGTARFFPRYTMQDWSTLRVVAAGAETTITNNDAARVPVTLTATDQTLGGAPTALDVAFVLDVTGSMADELRYLTVEFESIIERLQSTYPDADLRFGLVSYRDEGDAFVTQVYDFTGSVAEMRTYLGEQRADGGGDYPEAMDRAVIDANALSWRSGNVARVMILNADAPPHDNKLNATLTAATATADKGIRIYPLAASGVGDTAEYVMRIMAATTGGRHLFLTSDSGIGGEKQEPKTPCYQVTHLDKLLLRVLEAELAGEPVEAAESDILRQVGNYDRGVCSEQ